MKFKNKRGLEIAFNMIFAIIAGSVILFLALYATTKFIQTSQTAVSAESAKNLGNLLNPVVNGITSAYASFITFNKETRVYLGCETKTAISPIFGRQTISFSEQSGFLGSKWTPPGANISRYNKYIFSENTLQGKKLWVFSKPFYAGFRVDDLVMLTAGSYCFVGAPEFIQTEVQDLKIENINISSRIDLCSKDSVKVCFGSGSGCNITVYSSTGDYETGTISKNGKSVSYAGSLIYAAIFSSPEIYECNLNRLGSKITELGQIYKDKISIVGTKNCNTAIAPYLDTLIAKANNLTSKKINDVYSQGKWMDSKNCEAECKIYACA